MLQGQYCTVVAPPKRTPYCSPVVSEPDNFFVAVLDEQMRGLGKASLPPPKNLPK